MIGLKEKMEEKLEANRGTWSEESVADAENKIKLLSDTINFLHRIWTAAKDFESRNLELAIENESQKIQIGHLTAKVKSLTAYPDVETL